MLLEECLLFGQLGAQVDCRGHIQLSLRAEWVRLEAQRVPHQLP